MWLRMRYLQSSKQLAPACAVRKAILTILLVRGDNGFLLIRKITPCPNALGVWLTLLIPSLNLVLTLMNLIAFTISQCWLQETPGQLVRPQCQSLVVQHNEQIATTWIKLLTNFITIAFLTYPAFMLTNILQGILIIT